jgi:hypothetical protein
MPAPSSGQILLHTEYLTLRLSSAQRLVVLERSALPFTRVQELEGATEAVARALPVLRRRGLRILIDMRNGPLRVAPSFEPAFARYRQETERGFDRVAVVVSTTLGRVRGDRMAASCSIPIAVVGSTEEGLAFLDRPAST